MNVDVALRTRSPEGPVAVLPGPMFKQKSTAWLAPPPEQVTVNDAVALAAAPERTFTDPYAPVNPPTEHAIADARPVAHSSDSSATASARQPPLNSRAPAIRSETGCQILIANMSGIPQFGRHLPRDVLARMKLSISADIDNVKAENQKRLNFCALFNSAMCVHLEWGPRA
jgi:hypothetical protein